MLKTLDRDEVTRQLLTLGVEPGGVLVVHTAFSRVAPVEGGPRGLIEALQAALGPAGTLVMPSMSDDDEHPFDPGKTPCAGMGVVADTFWRMPGVLRSDSPHAFAASGPRAAEITAPHPPDIPHGLDSPIGRVFELDGQVLLLGAGQDANTTVHLAENMAGVRYLLPKHLTLLKDGQPTRFDYNEIDHCCENFNLLDPLLEAQGKLRRGVVGHAEARLARSRDIVEAALARLRNRIPSSRRVVRRVRRGKSEPSEIMNRKLRALAALAGGIAGIAGGTAVIGNVLWKRATHRAFRRLAPAPPAPPTTFSPDSLTGLPAPVVRYFQLALTPGQPIRSRFAFEQEAEFRTGFDAPWSPLTAEQRFSTQPPGFVWDARIRMAPLVVVRVRDSYLDGTGAMRVRLAGVIPMVDQSGSPELAAGALHRYLAEAVWFPTALLPSQGVSWEPIDDHSARATLTDGQTTVSLDFRFAENGEIVQAYTPTRFRDVNGTGVPTPWLCSYRNYIQVDGMRVPAEGEVGWLLPEGLLSYWRGTVRLRPAAQG